MSSAVSAREATFPPAPGGAAQTRRRFGLKRLALAGAALAVLAGAAWYGHGWWTNGRFIESTDDAYVGGNVTAIAPHVSGFVAGVLVTDNQRVRAGQLLIQLDSRDYQAALDHAKAVVDARAASLDGLRAQYVLQQATIRQQEAEVVAKSAQLTFASQDAARYQSLALTSAGSRQDAQRAASLEQQARASLVAASATLEAGRQQLKVLTAQTAEADANLSQARSDLRTAQLNLGYTEIRAPIDGFIGNRAAQVGAYVAAGAYLISVIPTDGLWVDANFKEDQLTRMVDGDTAAVVADVLPGHVFRGHIASVAPGTGAVFSVIPAENATGNFTKIVQRVPVRIVLDGGDADLRMLRPGLSTTARVDTRMAGQSDGR
jgi:membrane fusion protein (multidrug efflux system)